MARIKAQVVSLTDPKLAKARAQGRAALDTVRARAGGGALASLVSRLRGRDRLGWSPPQSSGRPAPRELARFASDISASPLRVRHDQPAPPVALCCVVDTSGSMHANAIASLGCALALVDAVRRAGGRGCVGAWNHYLLGWHEPIAQARLVMADGGTPLDAGLDGALHALSDASLPPHTVRVCMVLSDGEPNDHSACMASARRLRGIGVHIVGVFLRSGGDMESRVYWAADQGLHRLAGESYRDREARLEAERARLAALPADAQRLILTRLEAQSRADAARPLSVSLGSPACVIDRPEDLAATVGPVLALLMSGAR